MGLIRGAVKTSLLVFTFLLGYSYARHVYSDERYRIERTREEISLVDTLQHRRLLLDEPSFQLGGLDYRLHSLLHDPHFPPYLEQLVQRGSCHVTK